jgi:deazaflavin-dependent oxidoreductase (nitroreductase family)
MMAGMYRLFGGAGTGGAVCLLTTVGAKSGERRVAVARVFPEDARRWLVVGSAAGGRVHPAWVYNMAHDPDHIWIEIGRAKHRVTPELLTDDERETAWQRVIRDSPNFAKYLDTTDRVLPIIRLTAAD